MSASDDKTLSLWDIGAGKQLQTISFDSPVMNVVWHPEELSKVMVWVTHKIAFITEKKIYFFFLPYLISDSREEWGHPHFQHCIIQANNQSLLRNGTIAFCRLEFVEQSHHR